LLDALLNILRHRHVVISSCYYSNCAFRKIPENPFVSTVIADLTSTHKNWWECDTGIAYIVAYKKEEGWRSRGVKIFDLSDPVHPRYIRDYGVVGQEPGSSGEPVPAALHGPIRLGNRV